MRLFLDLDGTMADFHRHYKEKFGIELSDTVDVDWKLLAGSDFFKDLPPMPDMAELWAATKDLKPTILTGLPKAMPLEASKDKREWVDKHLGADVPMIGCRAREKHMHMEPGDIIIDNMEKCRVEWEKKGGIWIVHTDAASSIRQLDTYRSFFRSLKEG